MISVRGSGNTIQEIHVFDTRERERGGERTREARGRKRGGYIKGRKEKGGRGKRSVGREAPRLVGPPPL